MTTALCFCWLDTVGIMPAAILSVSTIVFSALAGGMGGSLLPLLFPPERLHTGSLLATMSGNVGAAFQALLVILLMNWLSHGEMNDTVSRLIVLEVCCCWMVLLLLLWKYTPEPLAESSFAATVEYPSLLSRVELCLSQRNLRRFLLASMLVGEGASTLFHMYVLYAMQVCNLSHSTVASGMAVNRVCGIVFAVLWWRLVDRGADSLEAARRGFLAVCALLCTAAGVCIVMEQEWQYWLVVLLLAMAGTGWFGLSKSLLAVLCPVEHSALVFGVYGMFYGAAGLIGPWLFALATHVTQSPQAGFGAMLVLVVSGAAVFMTIEFDAYCMDRNCNEVQHTTVITEGETLKLAHTNVVSHYGSVSSSN